MTYERFSEICLVFLPCRIDTWHLDDTNSYCPGHCQYLSCKKTPRLVQIETWEINPLFNGKSKQPRPRHHDGGKGNSQVDAKVSNLFYTAKRNPMLICVSVIGWF